MKIFRCILLSVFLSFGLGSATMPSAQAQCAMCSLNAENATQGENTQGKGLNDGILFLLAIPYLIAVGVGVLWYKRYRNKKKEKEFFPTDS